MISVIRKVMKNFHVFRKTLRIFLGKKGLAMQATNACIDGVGKNRFRFGGHAWLDCLGYASAARKFAGLSPRWGNYFLS